MRSQSEENPGYTRERALLLNYFCQDSADTCVREDIVRHTSGIPGGVIKKFDNHADARSTFLNDLDSRNVVRAEYIITERIWDLGDLVNLQKMHLYKPAVPNFKHTVPSTESIEKYDGDTSLKHVKISSVVVKAIQQV